MSNSMFMFDDINISAMPPGAYAYAGYVDGRWQTYPVLQRVFPSAKLLSITVFGNDADCADVETGDMTNAQVYTWFVRQLGRLVYRPCVYTSAGNMAAMQATMAANGFARSSYRLWSAHYTGTSHFCAPDTCGYGLDQADATQFTPFALGRSLDESIISDTFFGSATSDAHNPVGGLTVTRRGFTSIDLAWDGQSDATGYTVKVTNTLGNIKQDFVTAETAVRVGHLQPLHSYTFSVRAHPGGSVGADATVKSSTR